MTAAARPRPAPSPPPLGEVAASHAEQALLCNLLVNGAATLAAVREVGLTPADVQAETLRHALRAAADLADAGEVVDLASVASALTARKIAHPAGKLGWWDALSDCGLCDHDPARWCRALRGRALRLRLRAAAQAAAERRAGALHHLHEVVEELVGLAGAP